jgi:hypothetical protein
MSCTIADSTLASNVVVHGGTMYRDADDGGAKKQVEAKKPFVVSPLPRMRDQRASPGILPNFLIDPTCGRYCLKSLLRWAYSHYLNIVVEELPLPKATTSFYSDIIGYDPYFDFPAAERLLEQVDGRLGTLDAWGNLLRNHGPVILSGDGLGHASSFIGHYILLVGCDFTNNLMFYKDPLRGNEVFEESFKEMNPKISDFVYAKRDIAQRLQAVFPRPHSGLAAADNK